MECHKQSLCASRSKKEALITAGHVPGIQFANLCSLSCWNSFVFSHTHKTEGGGEKIRPSLSTISIKQKELTSIDMLPIEVPAQQKRTNLLRGQNEHGRVFVLHAKRVTPSTWAVNALQKPKWLTCAQTEKDQKGKVRRRIATSTKGNETEREKGGGSETGAASERHTSTFIYRPA